MTKGTGGFPFANPNHTGSLGTSTFSANTPIAKPKAIPSQCAFVILFRILSVRFCGYAFAC